MVQNKLQDQVNLLLFSFNSLRPSDAYMRQWAPGRRQAIIRTIAGILLIRPLGTNFSEILIEILIFSFKKMRLKVSSAKRRPFSLGINVLTEFTDHSLYGVLQQATFLCMRWQVGCFLTQNMSYKIYPYTKYIIHWGYIIIESTETQILLRMLSDLI